MSPTTIRIRILSTLAGGVAAALVLAGAASAAAAPTPTEALAAVGLSDRSQHLPSQMSGGQQQRTAIARAIVTNPDVLLADEPTGNLDSERSVEIMELLTGLNRDSGITVLMVTHEADMAAYANTIIHFKDGLVERIDSGMRKVGAH